MSKKAVVLLIVFALLIGGGVGFWGGKYYYIDRPEKLAMEEVKQQQRELDSMVRHGEVVSVKSNEVTLNVTQSGDKAKEGKTITVTIDSDTNVQNGAELLKNPVDLTKYLKPGTVIDVLERDNKALAIYWEADEPTVIPEEQQTPNTEEIQQDANEKK